MSDFLDGLKHAARCAVLVCLLPVYLVALVFVGLAKLWEETR